MERIEKFLKERAESGLLRTLRPITSKVSGKVNVAGKEYIDFSSNDYLGLSGHPKIAEAAAKAMQEFGTSGTGSRLLSGDLVLHHRLEEEVARFKDKEAALVFNSGYQANVGIISALCDKNDCIFSDRLNHASIVDGILLSGVKFWRFRHNDMQHLEELLKKERANFDNAFIITETVFSMDGDLAPLKELVALKEKYDCKILVDEAHATGIFGQNGSGLVEEEGLTEEIDFIMGTFSKALGSFGAYFTASKNIIDYLINASRSFIYSTALPPAVIGANLAGIELVKEEPWRREQLKGSWKFLREGLKSKGFQVWGDSQIIPVIIGDNLKAAAYARELQNKGYWVLPIRPPTVPEGQARLRFSLTANHQKDILEKLIRDLNGLKI